MLKTTSVDDGNYGMENLKVSFVAALFSFTSLLNNIAHTHNFCSIVFKPVGTGSLAGDGILKIAGLNSKGWLSSMF